MKLRKFLNKYISQHTYVKIGYNGECLCSCKKENISLYIINTYSDYKIDKIGTGILYTIDDRKETVNIYLK